MNEVILSACKELVDDAKIGCVDMVFKDVCVELLAKAKLILTTEQFKEFATYVAERLKETTSLPLNNEKLKLSSRNLR